MTKSVEVGFNGSKIVAIYNVSSTGCIVIMYNSDVHLNEDSVKSLITAVLHKEDILINHDAVVARELPGRIYLDPPPS